MKKIIILLLFTALLSGCMDSFLKVKPIDFLDGNSYYQTEDQFNLAVNGAYSNLRSLFTGSMWSMSEMRSDNTSYQYNVDDRSGADNEQIDEFRMNATNGISADCWSTSYNAIAKCNTILNRITDMTFDKKDQFIGEAHFLRAYYYFNLVRFFGGVPLITKEVGSSSEAFDLDVKASVDDVYKLIVADLEIAVKNLPDSYDSSSLGRATQGAANAVLAEVYMTLNQFDKAISPLQSVIASGKYSLLPSYASVFDINNENNAESVFEVQYIEGTSGQYSNFMYTFVPYNSGTTIIPNGVDAGTGSGWNIPTQDMLDAYEKGDLRKAASLDTAFIDPNDGKVVPYVIKYSSTHATRYETGNNFPVIRYADVLLMLAECLNETAYSASGQAATLLNQVRSRAGLQPATNLNSQANFRKAIAHERQVELEFEDHRWFDLLRTGKAKEVMAAHGLREKQLKPETVSSSSYATIKLLYPIPSYQIQINPKLKQNDEYTINN